jgi:AcrR family transcriptional regulator
VNVSKVLRKKPPERDRERTRDKILTAARRAFARHGYAQTGVREIAAAAGINPALIVRYFGGKVNLFLAVVESDLALPPFLEADRRDIGRALVRHVEEKPRHDDDAFSILLKAANEPSLAAPIARLVKERLLDPLAQWLGGRDAEARAALLIALFSGVWICKSAMPLPPLSGKIDRAAAASLAALVQSLVTP